jgi:predicted amidohydrolase YtcJ
MLPGDAVAIRDGRIVGTGALADVRALVPDGTRAIDAAGGLVTPGFVDAHVHLGLVASDTLQCDLAGAASLAGIGERIAAFAAGSDVPWVLGGGWDRGLFPASGPTATLLDRLVPDRPAMLFDADHHAAWVNTAALERAGIDAATPDPHDGRIGRLADGRPSGFLADGALALMAAVVPEPDAAALGPAIVAASRILLAAGVTGWQEAALGAYGGIPDFTDGYRHALAGGLRGRATGAILVPFDLADADVDAFVAHCVERARENADLGFPTATAKLMLDGIVESRTAALLAPYEDDPADVGQSHFTAERVRRIVPALNAAGIAVHVHALGDRAVREALDGFAAVPAETRARLRNHVAHIQLIAPDDVPRFAELGVTANAQPYWAFATAVTRDLTVPLIGAERARELYVFGALHAAGADLAIGSDWPVTTYEPWAGIHVAVNRRAPGDVASAPLNPEQALPLAVALDAYTRGSSRLLGLAGGVLEPGGPADLIVADRDPFAGPAADIHETRTVVTILDGEVVAER